VKQKDGQRCLQGAAVLNDDFLAGGSVLAAIALDLLHYVHALHHRAEHHVLAVKPTTQSYKNVKPTTQSYKNVKPTTQSYKNVKPTTQSYNNRIVNESIEEKILRELFRQQIT
jgi:hypothetical protein